MSKHPFLQDYLAFLEQAGASLAKRDPSAAVLAGSGFDPDVERLLEGMAFIASKIEEKHAESEEQICQLMMDTLFPHYLCPVPSATVVAFQPQLERPTQVIPRGTEIHSTPVEGTPCRFLTTQDVEVHGLVVDRVSWERGGVGASLSLRFAGPQWQSQEPQKDRLRLFLHGEPLLTRTLFQALVARLDRIELLDERGQVLDGSSIGLTPVGYGAGEALLDYPLGSFDGFRLLQEYFALPEKFMFVDIEGVWAALNRTAAEARGSRFSLRFQLRVDTDLAPTTEHIRLSCTPAVNLFEHTADPIRRDTGQLVFRVRPSGTHLHQAVYRVARVFGRDAEGLLEYPLLSELDLARSEHRFAQLFRRHFDSEVETYVGLFDEGTIPERQTIMVDLLCTNGRLPTALGPGDVDTVRGLSEPAPVCRNLLTPTRTADPPLGEPLRRCLIQHMNLSQQALYTLEALRLAITLYDFTALREHDAAQSLGRLSRSLVGAQTETVHSRRDMVPVWGQATRVDIDPGAFAVHAESALLGNVLRSYLALQAPLNRYSNFTLR